MSSASSASSHSALRQPDNFARDAQVLHDVLQDGSCGNGPVDACLAAGCDDVRTFGCAVRCILVLEVSFELCKPLLKTVVINDGPIEAFVLATMPILGTDPRGTSWRRRTCLA